MRLIDADALIERMKNKWDMQDLYLPVHFEDLVKEQPTVGDWISVKDRLPEKSGDVLVCCGKHNSRTSLSYSCRHHAFNAFDCLPDAENKIDDVKYWMPLPEPPKEVKKDENN